MLSGELSGPFHCLNNNANPAPFCVIAVSLGVGFNINLKNAVSELKTEKPIIPVSLDGTSLTFLHNFGMVSV